MQLCLSFLIDICSRSLILFSKKKVSKSFKNNQNRKGYIFSPCFTPTSLLKNTEHYSPFRIHVLIFLYILYITLKMLPCIFDFCSFCHNPNRQTVSNALLKLTKEQNIFFFQKKNTSLLESVK